jgi:hypothetical protein
VGLIVRSKEDKLDGPIPGFFTIGTIDNNVVALFSAHITIQVYDDEIAFHRTGIKALPISLQRFSHSDGILNNHVNFLLDQFLKGDGQMMLLVSISQPYFQQAMISMQMRFISMARVSVAASL